MAILKKGSFLELLPAIIGEMFHEDWDYCALTTRHDGKLIADRCDSGWVYCKEVENGSETFVVLGKPRENQ